MKNYSLWIGGFFAFILLFLAVFGPNLPFVDIESYDDVRMEDGIISAPPYPPSTEHWLGTDRMGWDLLSLMIASTRDTVLIILAITVIRYVIALLLAIVSYKQHGMASWILNGWNQLFSGLPALIAAIMLINLPFIGGSPHRLYYVIVLIALFEVGRVGYIFQQKLHDLSKQPFVESGRMVGHSQWGLVKKYYLPFLLPQIVVQFIMDMGRVMLLLGQLAFLLVYVSTFEFYYDAERNIYVITNLGDWTTQLAGALVRSDGGSGFGVLYSTPWLALSPALFIAFAVITFFTLGEGLRQYFDTRSTSSYNAKLEAKTVKGLNASSNSANKSPARGFNV